MQQFIQVPTARTQADFLIKNPEKALETFETWYAYIPKIQQSMACCALLHELVSQPNTISIIHEIISKSPHLSMAYFGAVMEYGYNINTRQSMKMLEHGVNRVLEAGSEQRVHYHAYAKHIYKALVLHSYCSLKVTRSQMLIYKLRQAEYKDATVANITDFGTEQAAYIIVCKKNAAFLNLKNKSIIDEIKKSSDLKTFITSDSDDFSLVGVQKTPLIHGYGVFSKKAVEKGKVIAEYIGEIITAEAAKSRKDTSYIFKLEKNKIIDAKFKGGISRFYNHSAVNANVFVKIIMGKIKFITKRVIKKGEQLLVDYGDSFCFTGKTVFLNPRFGNYIPRNFLIEHRENYSESLSKLKEKCSFTKKTFSGNYFYSTLWAEYSLSFNVATLSQLKTLDPKHIDFPIIQVGTVTRTPLENQSFVTPLMIVAAIGCKEKLGIFLKLGADPNIQDTYLGHTALTLLLQRKDLPDAEIDKRTELLLKHDAQFVFQDSENNIPHHYAIRLKSTVVLERLLKQGIQSGISIKMIMQLVNNKSQDVLADAIARQQWAHVDVIFDYAVNHSKISIRSVRAWIKENLEFTDGDNPTANHVLANGSVELKGEFFSILKKFGLQSAYPFIEKPKRLIPSVFTQANKKARTDHEVAASMLLDLTFTA